MLRYMRRLSGSGTSGEGLTEGAAMTLRTMCQVSLLLGAFSVLAILGSILALQDISKGEVNLGVEWSFLRVSLLLIIVFHAFALAALWRSDQAERSRER